MTDRDGSPERQPDELTHDLDGDSAVAGVEGAAGGAGRASGLWADAWFELRRNPLFIIAALLILLMVTMAIAPWLFTDVSPRDCSLARSLERPSREAWFGYNLQGCDYYARTIYGARPSITIGVLTTLGAGTIAVIFGSLAGYYGRWVDTLIARVTDIWFAVPTVLGAIVMLSVLGERGIAQITLVLVVFGWPAMLRLMRSSVLAAAQSDYVLAARALGASDLRIIGRHVLPNALTPVLVYGTIFVGLIIVAEAALTFLGVGLQLPAVSWGLAISGAQHRLLNAPHLLFFPGAFLSITVFSFILMGDALRDALDPKLR